MKQIFHKAFFAMNTRCYVVFPDAEHNLAERVFHNLQMEAVRIESKLSRFLPHSELSRVNKLAYERPVRPDNELFEILSTRKKYYDLTGGALDVTLRPLMNFWNSQAEDELGDITMMKAWWHRNTDWVFYNNTGGRNRFGSHHFQGVENMVSLFTGCHNYKHLCHYRALRKLD